MTQAIQVERSPHLNLLKQAIRSTNPTAAVQSLLGQHPDLPRIAGEFWASGFGAEQFPRDVAALLVERGAPLSIHAAAAIGLTSHVSQLLHQDPTLVYAKGGDGATPLHFTRDTEIARLLLQHGANIDARDDDHNSTPAEWRIGDAPQVSRLLLDRGAAPGIFLAAALGDNPLTERLIALDPTSPSHRIGRAPEYPPIGHQGRGGSILQWTLAFNSYPHQISLTKGHTATFDLLYRHSDPKTRLLVCCLLARRPEAEAIAAEHPGIIEGLPPADLELLARYCWETNTNYEAVRLMLDLGFPVAHPETSHGYSPLHNAAWAGSADLVDLLIARGHPVDLTDPRYYATPLGFALHDCLIEKRHPEGEFARVVQSLLAAGSPWDPSIYPTGNPQVDAVLQRHLR